MLRHVEDAVPVFERAGDDEARALAEAVRFNALDRAGAPGLADHLPRVLMHARRANARHFEHYVEGWVCVTLPRGTLHVDEAIARATEIRDTSTSAYVRSSAIGALGPLYAMRGEFDEARALVESARALLEELGLRHAAAAHAIAVAEVETMAGDDPAAERILRAGQDAVTALGDGHSAANAAWRLALVLARQGKDAEAERYARVAERAQPRSFWVDVWWRIVLARVEARRGAGERARRLVQDARERMPSAEESGMQADALLESAEALHAAGLEDEAAALVAEAAGVAERLGYVVARRRADEAQRALTA
jgi:hypothetical protein